MRPLHRLALRSLACALVLSTALVAGTVNSADAAVVSPFQTAYTVNTTGAVDVVGNSSVKCNQSLSGCNAALNGTVTGSALNNNNWYMTYIDVDGDGSTFNSSSATVSLPAGSQVLYAGLSWGGCRCKGNSDFPGALSPPTNTNAAAATVKFKGAGDAYTTLTADRFSIDGGNNFTGWKDVTSLVAPRPQRAWTVADIQTGQGGNIHGGWGLVVAYSNPSLPLRNLTVTQGFATIDRSDPQVRITASGFKTPPTGPVRTRLGSVVYEGDRASTGDYLQLLNRSSDACSSAKGLTDAVRPPNNYFNSNASQLGAKYTARTPAFDNLMGHDVGIADIGGVLNNSVTSATACFGTNLETILPAVLTFETDIFAPRINPVKSMVDLNGPPLLPGDRVRFTLGSTNTGDEPSKQTVLTDALDADLTYAPGTLTLNGSPLTDAAGDDVGEVVGQDVTVRLGAGATASTGGQLAVNGSATVTFEATVGAGVPDGSVVDNVGTVGYRSFDLVDSFTGLSNETSVAVQPRSADLAVVKTGAATTAAGSNASYQITVSNGGPDPAAAPVTVTDTLPPGAGFVSATGSGWTCATAGATVTCTRGTALAPGSSAPVVDVVLAVPTGATLGAVLDNTATVTSPTADPVPANNTSTASTTVTVAADLTTSVSHAGDLQPGQQKVFTVESANNGPAAAADAEVVVNVPAGLTILTAAGTGWTCALDSPTQATCSRTGPVAPGEPLPQLLVTTSIAADVGNGLAGDVTATISSTTDDPVPANNTGVDPVVVAPLADLALEKSHSGALPNPVLSGSPVEFTLQATNVGPGAVPSGTRLVVVDTLPTSTNGGTFSFVGATGTGWTCGAAGATVTCELVTSTSYAPGALLPAITLSTTAVAPDPDITNLTNTAVLSAPDAPALDPYLPNNTGSDRLDVSSSADLGTTVVVTGDPITAGIPSSAATLTFPVTNNGPTDDLGPVVLRGQLGDGLTFATAPAGTGWACALDSPTTFTCTKADGLTNGTTDSALTATVVAAATVPPSSIGVFTRVSSPTFDPEPANDAGAGQVRVTNVADLSVSLSMPGPLVAGGSTTATVTVTNLGPSPAGGTVVSVPLPDGVAAVSATGTGWTCEIENRTAVCAYAGDLAVGASPSFDLVVSVPPDATAAVSLTATVGAGTPDPDLNNNTSTDSLTPEQRWDLAVTLDAPADFVPGADVTASITVTSNGPSATTPVVRIPVPAGTTVQFVGGPGWTCTSGADPVVCTADAPLAGGSTAPPIGLTVSTTTGALVPVAWSTQVCSPTAAALCPADTDPANNAATATTSPLVLANLQATKQVVGTLAAGATASWTMTVQNLGPTDDPGPFTVVDNFPASVRPTAASGSGWSCSVVGQQVLCTHPGPLANNGLLPTITLTGVVAPGTAGPLTNTASVSSPATDPDPSIAESSITGFLGEPPTTPAWTDETFPRVLVGCKGVIDGVAASGVPAPTYAVSAGRLPLGMFLDPVRGTIYGTPLGGQLFAFTITATNTVSSISASFTGGVASCVAPPPPPKKPTKKVTRRVVKKVVKKVVRRNPGCTVHGRRRTC